MDTPTKQQHRHSSNKAHSTTSTDQTVLQPPSPNPLPHAQAPHFPWLGLLGPALVVTAISYGLYRLGKVIFRPTDANGFVEADYTIPHCKFESTDEGFRVTYRKLPEWLHISFRQSHDNTQKGGGNPLVLVGLLIGLLSNLTVGLVVWVWQLFFPMVIEVTRDAVIIKGLKLARADFRSFTIGHTRPIHKDEASAVLAYGYGNRSFKISGTWRESEATEIAAALNAHLRVTPIRGGENNPSGELLRDKSQSKRF